MFVYFIQAGHDGPVKIGTSKHPYARLQEMQTGHYEELRIIGVIKDGSFELEKRLHHVLAAHHIAREWFRPHADVVAASQDRYDFRPYFDAEAEAASKDIEAPHAGAVLRYMRATRGMDATQLARRCPISIGRGHVHCAEGRRSPSIKVAHHILDALEATADERAHFNVVLESVDERFTRFGHRRM